MSAVKILTFSSSASSRASLDTGTSKARMTAYFLAELSALEPARAGMGIAVCLGACKDSDGHVSHEA
eukprot:1158904-Pelagomonas_calceolata.AAC.11